MPHFYISFAGRERDRIGVECSDVAMARNIAVQRLGGYLADHPGFANEGHWRVTIDDEVGRTVATVIVATVTPRLPDEPEQ
ncbi:DUF6894 family protein [Sphingomonas endophytica]|uniref:DUF6894 domain-containing protein n=1 Tax=Sphingomonas endophytica TaxID=869719 RepID=A0A147I005_9SPHN|nr:hypothetical protein [Sphingomonas endophytica]KTT70612.1 hypothetical protein NS334_12065 [Sphingomonas endophytica]